MKKSVLIMVLILSSFNLFSLGKSGQLTDTSKKTGDGESAKEIIKVAALNGPSGIGMAHMINSDTQIYPGFEFEYSVILSPSELMGKLLHGEYDIAALPVNMPALLYSKGMPYKLGAVTGEGILYIVSSDTSVKSINDLEGKTLHTINPNSTPDILTRYILKMNGLVPGEDLSLDLSYGHTELAQALIEGIVDTAVLPEPFVTMVMKKNSSLGIAVDLQSEFSKIGGGDSSYPITAIAVNNELANSNPEVLEAFFKRYEESINRVNSNAEEAGTAAGKAGFTIPAAVITEAVPRLNLVFLDAGEARKDVENFYSILLDFNPDSIGGSLPGDDFYWSR